MTSNKVAKWNKNFNGKTPVIKKPTTDINQQNMYTLLCVWSHYYFYKTKN